MTWIQMKKNRLQRSGSINEYGLTYSPGLRLRPREDGPAGRR